MVIVLAVLISLLNIKPFNLKVYNMTNKLDYLLEIYLIDADEWVYYACNYEEYKQALAETPANQIKDRTNCGVSWFEYNHNFQQESMLSY